MRIQPGIYHHPPPLRIPINHHNNFHTSPTSTNIFPVPGTILANRQYGHAGFNTYHPQYNLNPNFNYQQANLLCQINIRQTKVYCPICESQYFVKDTQMHAKLHLKQRKYQPINKQAIDQLKGYSSHHKKIISRPVVVPQQHNLSYNPRTYQLIREVMYSDVQKGRQDKAIGSQWYSAQGRNQNNQPQGVYQHRHQNNHTFKQIASLQAERRSINNKSIKHQSSQHRSFSGQSAPLHHQKPQSPNHQSISGRSMPHRQTQHNNRNAPSGRQQASGRFQGFSMEMQQKRRSQLDHLQSLEKDVANFALAQNNLPARNMIDSSQNGWK